jgi:hypothetical protein
LCLYFWRHFGDLEAFLPTWNPLVLLTERSSKNETSPIKEQLDYSTSDYLKREIEITIVSFLEFKEKYLHLHCIRTGVGSFSAVEHG